jgi:hypothetical protein
VIEIGKKKKEDLLSTGRSELVYEVLPALVVVRGILSSHQAPAMPCHAIFRLSLAAMMFDLPFSNRLKRKI